MSKLCNIQLKSLCIFECAEMHRHTHWERIPGESRRRKGHIQLSGLATTPANTLQFRYCLHIFIAHILVLRMRLKHLWSAHDFTVAAPSVLNSLPSDIRACSSSHTFHSHIHFLLKPIVLSRPSVPPIGSNNCLRFGLKLTLHTFKDFIYLFTYLNQNFHQN